MKKEMKKKDEAFKEEPTAPIVNDRAIHQAIAEEAEQLVLSERKGEKKLTSIPRAK